MAQSRVIRDVSSFFFPFFRVVVVNGTSTKNGKPFLFLLFSPSGFNGILLSRLYPVGLQPVGKSKMIPLGEYKGVHLLLLLECFCLISMCVFFKGQNSRPRGMVSSVKPGSNLVNRNQVSSVTTPSKQGSAAKKPLKALLSPEEMKTLLIRVLSEHPKGLSPKVSEFQFFFLFFLVASISG